MPDAFLVLVLMLHGAATWMAVRLAWRSRRLSWIAFALAIGLMGLWRAVSTYESLLYDRPADLGTELLAGVIAALTVIGMRTASRALLALRKSQDRLHAVVDSAMDAIVVVDENGVIRYANSAVEHVFGHRASVLVGRPFTALVPDTSAAFDRMTPNGEHRSIRERIRAVTGVHESGRGLDLEVTFGTHEEDGQLLRTGIVRDVTAREELLVQLRRSEERYSLAAKGANDGLWDWDLESGEVFFSPRWKEMLGLPEQAPCSSPADWFSRIHPDDAQRVQARLGAHLEARSDHFDCEYRIRRADGEYAWMLCRGLAVRDSGGTAYRIAGSQTDISGRKLAEERLWHDALHDALTGLPNRVLFADRLKRCLKRGGRGKAWPAVLFVDLDRFKNVNDSLGHATGDRLLVEVARKLEECVRPTDTVARLGGDEFAILLEDVHEAGTATEIANRVLARLSESVRLDEHDVVATASIGIAWGEAYGDAGDLLRDADAAMYRAKELGKARYQVFDRQLREAAHQRLEREADLRRGVEQDEIDVAYQPIISLATGRISGFEALARWRRGGVIVPPSEFIPLAEETGLIAAIDRRVMARACAELASLQESFALAAPLSMSLNVSGRHLAEPGLVEWLREMLAGMKIEPGSLRLEVTESWLLADDAATRLVLEQLRGLDFKLVIDDFGTGYSSLSYLYRLPIDAIKLDRSFVRDMESSPERQEIVRTVVALARNLKLEVVAEGVETSGQLDRLRQLGCDLAQGFYFSHPVHADAARALVAREVEVFDVSGRTSKRRRRAPRRLVA